MLEHIFRNINDIRVFDAFYVEYCDGEEVDIDNILQSLEYKESERIQIEDSVEHLVNSKILEKVNTKVEGWSGCRTCLWMDKFRIPRIGDHKNHKSFENHESIFPKYRIAINDINNYLYKALFEYMKMYSEEIEKENKQ